MRDEVIQANLVGFAKGLFKFLISGLPSFIIAIGLNWLFVSNMSLNKSLAYAIVLIIQVTINFFMCKWFVFKDNKEKSVFIQFIQFMSGIIVFRVLDWACYSVLTSLLDIYYIWIQLFNVFFFSIFKYLYSKRVIE